MDWGIAEGVEWLGEGATEDHPQHHSAILGEAQAATKGRAGAKSHCTGWCAAWRQRKVTRTTGKAPPAVEGQREQLRLSEREPLVLGMTLPE